jgi:tetratricopeptide (TPR) repeat protein
VQLSGAHIFTHEAAGSDDAAVAAAVWVEVIGFNLKSMKLCTVALALKSPSDRDVWHRELERAIELRPADPVINDHLGDAYWRSGRQDDARFEWLAALRLKPEAARKITLREKLEKGLPAMPGARLASRP